MQTDNQTTKVVSLLERSQNRKKESDQKDTNNVENYDFETAMKRNAENQARMKKERSKSNRGVIRSYRLKH